MPELETVPTHVAIIMDGNGRWANERGLPRLKGHEEGAQSVLAVLRAAKAVGVKYLTLYAFSTENWKRPKDEVDGLMTLLGSFMQKHSREFLKNKIRLRVMGELDRLPRAVRGGLSKLMKESAKDYEHTLIVALSYGSRKEIADAAKAIARKTAEGELDPDAITEETFSQYLYLPDVPDPELMIRTSGELRLSNFLLWQLSYAEFYVTDTYWPDFREKEFFQALESFGKRGRRFGGIVTQ
ncbi:isoprenyl transferase [Tichowtungia aerotolerans]|uniref:Isoprenyl transferase n=1 Tax=Tichowtungia aerotolerans TaxID=2697043 RepID=A0A6P1MG06_9BACT|nr:isoprenyl transferase [Tichowtungia aerotolerans]